MNIKLDFIFDPIKGNGPAVLTSIETLKTLKKDENACKWIALPQN